MDKKIITGLEFVIFSSIIFSINAFAGVPFDEGAYTTSEIGLNESWKYSEYSKINDGKAILYIPSRNANNIIVALNAGHGTKGGEKVKTLCHPDGSPKTTGGSTLKGATEATAVSAGMSFTDGTREADITLGIAKKVREVLLGDGYSVLMLRDSDDVQLDNIGRTVISNNIAECMVSFHWDGDSLDYDKGVFYIKVPEQMKDMEPVSSYWQKHDALGTIIIAYLERDGFKKYGEGCMSIDLTQTSYSEIPSVDLELGNQCSSHDENTLEKMAKPIAYAIEEYCKLLEK